MHKHMPVQRLSPTLVTLTNGRHMASEQYRQLLTSIDFLGVDQAIRSVMITKIGRKAPAFTPGDRSYPKGYISPLARESQKFLRVLH